MRLFIDSFFNGFMITELLQIASDVTLVSHLCLGTVFDGDGKTCPKRVDSVLAA